MQEQASLLHAEMDDDTGMGAAGGSPGQQQQRQQQQQQHEFEAAVAALPMEQQERLRLVPPGLQPQMVRLMQEQENRAREQERHFEQQVVDATNQPERLQALNAEQLQLKQQMHALHANQQEALLTSLPLGAGPGGGPAPA